MWYFGTREMGCARPGSFQGFAQGLAEGAHVKCKRSPAQFRKALCEACAYLQACTLPSWKRVSGA